MESMFDREQINWRIATSLILHSGLHIMIYKEAGWAYITDKKNYRHKLTSTDKLGKVMDTITEVRKQYGVST